LVCNVRLGSLAELSTQSCDSVLHPKADTCDAKTNVCFVLRAIITSWTCVNCAHRVKAASTLIRGAETKFRKSKKITGNPSEGFAGRKYYAS
jgi:hypothetical protein